jgi:hypothetical protein
VQSTSLIPSDYKAFVERVAAPLGAGALLTAGPMGRTRQRFDKRTPGLSTRRPPVSLSDQQQPRPRWQHAANKLQQASAAFATASGAAAKAADPVVSMTIPTIFLIMKFLR